MGQLLWWCGRWRHGHEFGEHPSAWDELKACATDPAAAEQLLAGETDIDDGAQTAQAAAIGHGDLLG